MTKPVSIAIMLFIMLLTFAGHSVAPGWLVNSQLGDMFFTVLVVLELIGLIWMIK